MNPRPVKTRASNWFGRGFRVLLVLAVGTIGAAAGTAQRPARAAGVTPPAILPLASVRPGMVGEALTVFSGTKPQPFKFHVVSVLPRFLPHQDIILVHLDDERTDKSGVVAGMSGSPCYIDGKLIGAIAYAWSFAKEPLAGVTPIESMLAERARPERRKGDPFAPGGGEASLSMATGSDASAALPTNVLGGVAPRAASAVGESRFLPVAVPLAVSGLPERAIADVTDELAPLGLLPMRAPGAGGGGSAKPGHVSPGSSIGVVLVRGDISAVGTGTVTWTDGETVLAFGHPMMGVGELNLPLCESEIHAFMNSLASSFKMASPLGEVGSLVQDRQSCIVGDLKRHTTLMPYVVTVSAPGAPDRTTRTEIARDKRLSPILASMVVSGAIATSEPDPVEAAVAIDTTMDVRGLGTLTFADHMATTDGLSARVVGSSRGVRALAELLSNPFAPAVIDRIDVKVRVDFRRDFAEIVAASLPGNEVEPGETTNLRVTLRPFAGSEYTETYPVSFPRALAGHAVKVEIASGALVKPDLARPESLASYVAAMRTYYTAASVVVSLETSDTGASLRGRLLPALPPGALDTLKPTTGGGRAETQKVAQRTVFAFPKLVSGKKDLTVRVRDDVVGR